MSYLGSQLFMQLSSKTTTWGRRYLKKGFIRGGFDLRSDPLTLFSKIQLVVYNQCCVLIG